MTSVVMHVAGSVKSDGRIWIAEDDRAIFEGLAFGRASRDELGEAVTIKTSTGQTYEGDVREMPDGALSPRRAMGAFLAAIQAAEGDQLRLSRVNRTEFVLEPA